MYDFEHEFQDGVNVLYGRNSVGKTTLLHILANALTGSFDRFAHLQFGEITITLSDSSVIALCRTATSDFANITLRDSNDREDTLVVANPHRVKRGYGTPSEYWTSERKSKVSIRRSPEFFSKLAVSYFPAFRAAVDAFASSEVRKDYLGRSVRRGGDRTEFARELFGQFVPEVNYPSLAEIEQRLRDELVEAFRRATAAETRNMVGTAIDIYKGTLNSYPSEQRELANLTAQIRESCDKIGKVSDLVGRRKGDDISVLKNALRERDDSRTLEADAQAVLGVYCDALVKVASEQTQATESLERYLNAVNFFFDDSRMRLVASESGQLVIRHTGGSRREVPLRTLSSGARQVAAMFFSATRMSGVSIILIDEPELSLHIDWQRNLLSKMRELTADKQVIVATHAPEISLDIDDIGGVAKKFRVRESPTPLPEDPWLTRQPADGDSGAPFDEGD